MTSKAEFFKTHNLFTIEKDSIPNWQDSEYKYFVIEHSKDYKYILTCVYYKDPFRAKTYLLYENRYPIEENTNFEAIALKFSFLDKGRKLK